MHPPLTNADYLQFLLDKHHITPEHSAGQNFLICPEPVEAVIAALEGGAEAVTELGAGMGPLTQTLLAAGFSVRAIERDTVLADILEKTLAKPAGERLELIRGDLREVAWEQAKPYALVGNIPYNLSGFILRRLTTLPTPPTQAVFLVQREVGQRITAIPGEMSLLGLSAQLWGTPHLLLQVPRSCFWPEPKVNSAVVMLVPHERGLALAERERILKVATVFFQQKRKQMGGVLKRSFTLYPEQIESLLATVGVAANARPQELSVEQWTVLTRQLTPNNVY